MGFKNVLRSLESRNFRLYYAGQSVSLIGTWMQRMATGWLVYNVTNSAFMLGLVTFAGQIPALFLSPYGGTISDRHSRYKILLTTQVASMIQAGLLAAMVLTDNYTNVGIISLAALLGVINAFDIPSRQSLLVELVENKDNLPNAIALNSSMVNMARLIGPAIAGFTLTVAGEGICFLINSISFLFVIFCLLKMKIPPRNFVKPAENVWTGLKEGYKYLKQSPDLLMIILLMACISFIVMPYSTLLPVFAKDVLKGDAGTFSWLNSIGGLGALCGAIYLAGQSKGKEITKMVIYATLVFSISLIMFSISTWLPMALFFIMTSGSGMIIQIASTNTFIQTNVDDRMRGRVLSYYVMAFLGMQPIGSFIIGLLANKIGAPLTVLFQGIAGLIVVLLFILFLKRTRKKVVV